MDGISTMLPGPESLPALLGQALILAAQFIVYFLNKNKTKTKGI